MGKCIGRSLEKKQFPFLCECINGFSGEDCSINSNKCGIYGYLKDCTVYENEMVNSERKTTPSIIGMTSHGETQQRSGNSANWSSYVTLSLLAVLCVGFFSAIAYYSKNSIGLTIHF